MPRGSCLWAAVAACLAGACSLEVTYQGSRYACPDGVCPDGHECRLGFCEPETADPPDAATDDAVAADVSPGLDAGPTDGAPPDARPPCVGGDSALDPATGHCYTLQRPSRTWIDATTFCASLGPTTHLAIVTTAAENLVVASLDDPVTPVQRAWLGATDSVAEGDWRWLDGTALSYSNWRLGEPNDFGLGEDCLAIALPQGGGWDDRDCAVTLSAICERE